MTEVSADTKESMDFFDEMDNIHSELLAMGFTAPYMKIETIFRDFPMIERIYRLSAVLETISEKYEESQPWFEPVRTFTCAVKQIVDINAQAEDDRDCLICLFPFEARPAGVIELHLTSKDALPNYPAALHCEAAHVVCVECLRNWLYAKKQNTCPFCRHEFRNSPTTSLSMKASSTIQDQAVVYQLQLLKETPGFPTNAQLEDATYARLLSERDWIDIVADLVTRERYVYSYMDYTGEFNYLRQRKRAIICGLSGQITYRSVPVRIYRITRAHNMAYNCKAEESYHLQEKKESRLRRGLFDVLIIYSEEMDKRERIRVKLERERKIVRKCESFSFGNFLGRVYEILAMMV